MFTCKFSAGDTVTHFDIVEEFKCGNMGGMRRSNATNSLIIISDHTKGLYEDKWIGDILHYTGMGKKGDQDIHFQQNRTLAESETNGIQVHLFEVLVPQKYIYCGIVSLAAKPYQENQNGEDGLPRKVWMFPVRPNEMHPIPETILNYYIASKDKTAKRLGVSDLKRCAEQSGSKNVGRRAVSVNVYTRSSYVAEYARRRADGICELCGRPAPFNDTEGNPYLECHHITWIAKGGSDTIDNTVALCPNCHRKMHMLDLKTDVDKLKELRNCLELSRLCN